MTEHPILFKGEMVRAILEGRKLQTRRFVKPQPTIEDTGFQWNPGKKNGVVSIWSTEDRPPVSMEIESPLGKPGDSLWVRETFGIEKHTGKTIFRADGGWAEEPGFAPLTLEGGKWKPSIFMPRALSRINLLINRVRVQRLQDISEADCLEEGIFETASGDYLDPFTKQIFGDPKTAFRSLWRAVNGPKSWDENPWLWAVSFNRMGK